MAKPKSARAPKKPQTNVSHTTYSSEAYATQLHRLAKRIKDNWSLCEFTGDCESETMLAQTLQVAARRQKAGKLPASFQHPNVLRGYTMMGGGVDNARGYGKLIDRKLIDEMRLPATALECSDVPADCIANGNEVCLLLLTPKALDAMEAHINRTR